MAVLTNQPAVEHGETYRFEVFDQSTSKERKISDFDVHRRASARAQHSAIAPIANGLTKQISAGIEKPWTD